MGKITTLLWALALLAPPSALADQTTAQQDAQKIHDNGSNNSLDESYGNALHAVSNFFDMNFPGAISHGFKAYGQYRNSQTMDDLRDKNQKLAGSMVTAGSGAVSSSAVTGDTTYVSPYACLDRKFLYEGSTGEVAGRLEKLSGISRSKMFQMAVDLHTNSKSPTDPDFIPWAMKAYNEEVSKVAPGELRTKLENLGHEAESQITAGIAKATFDKFLGAATQSPTMVAVKAEERAPASAVAPAEPLPEDPKPAVVAEVPVPAAAEGDPLANSLRFSARGTATTGLNGALMGLDRLGAEPVEGFLGDAMRSARDSAAEPSLFAAVSTKLKEINGRQHLDRRTVAQLPTP